MSDIQDVRRGLLNGTSVFFRCPLSVSSVYKCVLGFLPYGILLITKTDSESRELKILVEPTRDEDKGLGLGIFLIIIVMIVFFSFIAFYIAYNSV